MTRRGPGTRDREQAPHDPLLSVQGLTTVFDVGGPPITAVNDVSFEIRRGETLGLVGESGSGKSVTAFSILRLLPLAGRTTSGRVLFQGRDLLALSEREMCGVRGAGIGLVFQEPMAALNPVMRVGAQVAEALVVHGMAGKREARARAIELLRAVKIVDPEKRVDDYPHQLSGGHAPAGDAGGGAGLQAAAGHRRRADDGPRCHRPGPDPRPAARDEAAPSTCRCCSSPTTSA